MKFGKTRADLILLDSSEFSQGSGILDNDSINAQKAFKDINDRLLLADSEFDGLMSSTDKIKLNELSTDILNKETFISSGQTTFTCTADIFDCAVFVDGMISTEYTISGKDVIFNYPLDNGAEIIVYSSNFVTNLNFINDSASDYLTTWSSKKLEEEVNKINSSSVIKEEFTSTENQTDFITTNNISNVSVYINGILSSSSEYDYVDNYLIFNEGLNLGDLVTIITSTSVLNTSLINDSVTELSSTWSSAKIKDYIKSVLTKTDFDATENQTEFIVSHDSDLVQVFVEGLLLRSDKYTSNGSKIVLNTPCSLDDWVQIIG